MQVASQLGDSMKNELEDGRVPMSFDSLETFASLTRHLFATTQTIHQVHNSEVEFKSDTKASAIWL